MRNSAPALGPCSLGGRLLVTIEHLGVGVPQIIDHLHPLELHHLCLLLPTPKRRAFRTLATRVEHPLGIRPVVLHKASDIASTLNYLGRRVQMHSDVTCEVGHLEFRLDMPTVIALHDKQAFASFHRPPVVQRLVITSTGSLRSSEHSLGMEWAIIKLISLFTSDRYRFAPTHIVWRHNGRQPLTVSSGFVENLILASHGAVILWLPRQRIKQCGAVISISGPRLFPADNVRLTHVEVDAGDRRLASTLIPALWTMQGSRIGTWFFRADGRIDPSCLSWGPWEVEKGLIGQESELRADDTPEAEFQSLPACSTTIIRLRQRHRLTLEVERFWCREVNKLSARYRGWDSGDIEVVGYIAPQTGNKSQVG